MGSKSSKAASALPSASESAASAAKRATPLAGQTVPPSQQQATSRNPHDGSMDPHLAANLRAMGQVKVNKNTTTYRPTDQMLGILHKRQQEEEALDLSSSASSASRSASSRNKLSAAALTNLFDARKNAASSKEVQELCKLYNIDQETLDALAKYFTSPSVASESLSTSQSEAMKKSQSEKGNDFSKEDPVILAKWVDGKQFTA